MCIFYDVVVLVRYFPCRLVLTLSPIFMAVGVMFQCASPDLMHAVRSLFSAYDWYIGCDLGLLW